MLSRSFKIFDRDVTSSSISLPRGKERVLLRNVTIDSLDFLKGSSVTDLEVLGVCEDFSAIASLRRLEKLVLYPFTRGCIEVPESVRTLSVGANFVRVDNLHAIPLREVQLEGASLSDIKKIELIPSLRSLSLNTPRRVPSHLASARLDYLEISSTRWMEPICGLCEVGRMVLSNVKMEDDFRVLKGVRVGGLSLEGYPRPATPAAGVMVDPQRIDYTGE